MTTLDIITQEVSESLARAVNRRSFLRRLGSGAFLVLAGWAAGLEQL